MQVKPVATFLFIILLISCIGSRDISTQNLAPLYRHSEKQLHPEFVLHHDRDSVSSLYIKVLPEEFLFVRQGTDTFSAEARITAFLLASYDDPHTLDSGSATFRFSINEKGRPKVLALDIPIRHAGEMLIQCIIEDMNKNSREDFFVNADKLPTLSRQDFLLMDSTGMPIFRNYFSREDTFYVAHRDTSVTKLFCSYYHRPFELAAPPYTFDIREPFNYTADSFFTVGITSGINFPSEGFYHLQTDTTVKTGLTVFRFPWTFPLVTHPAQMLESVRYLTTRKEFEEMKSSQNIRTAVDNFWLSRGGSPDKTRNLIRKYYGRIQDANKYFTSHTEGWRTDRGMIYTIFGSPSTVYRGSVSESWIYGTPNSALSLNFFFTQVENPFTDNDFSLSRAPVYEGPWYRAVEIWRQGRAYNSMY